MPFELGCYGGQSHGGKAATWQEGELLRKQVHSIREY